MKKFLGTLLVLSLMFGFASKASASTIWYLQNVQLTGTLGTINVAGQFTNTGTTITAWHIELTGAVTQIFDNTGPATQSVSAYQAGTNGWYFAAGAPSQSFRYISFSLATPLLDVAAPTTILLDGNGTNVNTYENTFYCVIPCSEQQGAGASIVNQAPITSAAVPEPGTLGLLGLGLAGLVWRARRAS